MKISSQLTNSSQSRFSRSEWRQIQFDIAGTRLLRQRLLELGQSMVEAGLLQHAGEIFSLSPEEVRVARSQLSQIPSLLPDPTATTQYLQIYW